MERVIREDGGREDKGGHKSRYGVNVTAWTPACSPASNGSRCSTSGNGPLLKHALRPS